jgi:DNA-binding transcriptional LysR family regulator
VRAASIDLEQSLESGLSSIQMVLWIHIIHAMDLKAVDLNLLVVFDALVEHRGVTRAGEAIGLSQPAMSAALSRLRVLFGDPLFVRSGAEMKATPRALELAGPVRRVTELIRTEVLQRSGFEPAGSQRTFTIVTPDIGEVNFLPRLLARFEKEAPLASLRTVARPREAAAEALESGEADLAVGYFPDLQRAGFFLQKLFDNPHVCLVRKAHPAADALTLEAYLAASHAVVRPGGREHVFEQFLTQQGLRRRVVVELSHYMSLLPIVEQSDLIATVPLDLADVCVRHGALRIVEAPVQAPVISVHQFWHARYHKDLASLWLRGVLQSLFKAGSARG